MTSRHQTDQLRRLAAQVAELSRTPRNLEARQLWSDQNGLVKTRPPVYVTINCWEEVIPESSMVYKEGILRDVERYLRSQIYNSSLGYDLVVPPDITVPAVYSGPPADELWGVRTQPQASSAVGGSWGYNPPLREYEDIEELKKPVFRIDEQATSEQLDTVSEALGGLLDLRVDYGGPIGISASIGYIAALLRGPQQLLTDVLDNPGWVHRLMQFLSDAHVEYLKDMEAQGKVTPNHVRWPLCHEPICPDYDPDFVRLKDCWGYAESQDFDTFSPAMMDEFLLAYQIPIMQLTTLNYYGCCENLTHKYYLLGKIPGLRVVSVSPWTDFEAAVEAWGGNCVLNWRYPTAEVIFDFSPEKIRETIGRNLEIAGDAPVQIGLQDIQTLNGQPEHIRQWVAIAREAVRG